jgi:hypothetical protein
LLKREEASPILKSQGFDKVDDLDIAFLYLVRYIFKSERLDIQNFGVPQLHGKRYISEAKTVSS